MAQHCPCCRVLHSEIKNFGREKSTLANKKCACQNFEFRDAAWDSIVFCFQCCPMLHSEIQNFGRGKSTLANFKSCLPKFWNSECSTRQHGNYR